MNDTRSYVGKNTTEMKNYRQYQVNMLEKKCPFAQFFFIVQFCARHQCTKWVTIEVQVYLLE